MLAKGFTMKSLSAAAGQNETYIRDILTRQRTPTLDKFIKVAEVLGVPTSYLLGEVVALSEPFERDEAKLRSALLSYGVDRDDLRRIVAIINGFVDDFGEQPEQTPPDDRPEPANRRRVKAP